jgi:DNA-directed RNA polymerase specialized sigma24 family protein
MQPSHADFATDLQPRLLQHARLELRRLGLPVDRDEDIVQDAWARWLRTQPSRVEQWLRICVHGLAIDAARRRSGSTRSGHVDPLDMEPVGLEVLGA